jgi:hypothetical protein
MPAPEPSLPSEQLGKDVLGGGTTDEHRRQRQQRGVAGRYRSACIDCGHVQPKPTELMSS